jgi:hypothetical protein
MTVIVSAGLGAGVLTYLCKLLPDLRNNNNVVEIQERLEKERER